MRVQPEMQERLKTNDKILYPQTVKILSQAINTDLKVILSVCYYISFVFDESLLCLLVKIVFHLFVTKLFDENMDESFLANGASTTLGQLYTPTSAILNLRSGTANFNANRSTNNNEEEEESNNNNANSTITDQLLVSPLFGDWSIPEKKILLRNLLTVFSIGWCLIILFQVLFCLDKTYGGISYGFTGGLKNELRDNLSDNSDISNLWNIKDAYSTGSMVLSLVGELKFRNKVVKLISLLIMDFIVISLQLLEILLNYGVGLGLVNRIQGDMNATDNEGDALNNANVTNGPPKPQYDGYQGDTLVYDIQIHSAIQNIYRD